MKLCLLTSNRFFVASYIQSAASENTSACLFLNQSQSSWAALIPGYELKSGEVNPGIKMSASLLRIEPLAARFGLASWEVFVLKMGTASHVRLFNQKNLDVRGWIEHELLNKPSFPSFWQVICSSHGQSHFAVAATSPERFHFYDLNQLFFCGKSVLVTCRPTVMQLCLVTRIRLALLCFLAWIKLSQSSWKMIKPHVCSRLGAVTWTKLWGLIEPRRPRRKHVVTLRGAAPRFISWVTSQASRGPSGRRRGCVVYVLNKADRAQSNVCKHTCAARCINSRDSDRLLCRITFCKTDNTAMTMIFIVRYIHDDMISWPYLFQHTWEEMQPPALSCMESSSYIMNAMR